MNKLTLIAGLLCLSSIADAAPNLSMSCSVVKTGPASDYILEEGLGSIYDINEDGTAATDSDSTGAAIKIESGKFNLELGQGTWTSQNSKVSSKPFSYESDLGDELQGIEIKVKDSLGHYKWKVFPALKLAIVTFTGSEYKNAHLATVDCSGVKDIRLRF